MRVIVTGGSGFIGTNIIEYYLNKGYSVANIDNNSPRCKSHRKHWQNISLLEKSKLVESVRKFNPDIIFHSAARTDLDGKSLDDYNVNTVGVANLIESVRNVHGCKVIFLSSMLVCKLGYRPKHDTDYCPVNPYGESKVLGEEMVRRLDIGDVCWTIVRPTSIWGPWFSIPYINFFQAIRRGFYLHPLRRKIFRSYGYVGNTVYQLDKIVSASDKDRLGKTFYLADYPPLEIKKWADIIQVEMGVRRVRSVPLFLLRLLAFCGDFSKYFKISPPLSTTRLNNLLTEMVFDLDDLNSVAGELPYSLEEGVRETVKWMSSNN